MQFIIPKIALLEILAPAAASTRVEGTNPMLGHVLIEAARGQATITGTNLLLTMSRSTPVDIVTPGEICLPAREFESIARLMPDGSVQVQRIDNMRVELKSLAPKKKVAVNLRAATASDFPLVDKVKDADHKAVTLRVADLRAISEAVLYAASKDAHRPHLGVVHFERPEAILHAVTTDGYRLAYASAKVPFPATTIQGIGVPARELQRLLAALPEDGDVELRLAPGHLVVTCGPLRATLKLLDAPFPAWRGIIPEGFTHTCTIARADVALLLARAETLAAAKTGSTGFTFSAKEGGELAVSVDNPDQGAMNDSVAEGVAVSGDEIRLSLNARYIDEAIQHLSGEQVTFGTRGKLEVVHLSAVGTHDNDFRAIALVMPMAS